jgi:hypothetical protein
VTLEELVDLVDRATAGKAGKAVEAAVNDLRIHLRQVNAKRRSEKAVMDIFAPAVRELHAARISGSKVSPYDYAERRTNAGVKCTSSSAVEAFQTILRAAPEAFEAMEGLLPDIEFMMDLVESKVGGINATTLNDANAACRAIAEASIKPRIRRYLATTPGCHKDASTGRIDMTIDAMATFLLEEYSGFAAAQANGLISRAGAYNEGLLRRALLNAKLVEGSDFNWSGKTTGAKADFTINHTSKKGAPSHLYVEVKSYGARERLLRGLADTADPKVGVGFFTDPREFNAQRTRTLAGTGALAIYMPKPVYDQLGSTARAHMNSNGAAFYRPLEEFIVDIDSFVRNGVKAYCP